MGEKKTIKISLSTFFLILAIIAIIIMGMYIYKLNNTKTTATEQVNELNTQISGLENTVKSLQENADNENTTINTNETKIVESATNEISNNVEENSNIVSLLKNEGQYDYLKVTSIKEDNNKYLVEADYYTPTPIAEKEYSEMVSSKKITLNNTEYVFDNSNKTYNAGYGCIYIKGEPIESGYLIEKINNGYIFIHEVGGVYGIINNVEKHYSFYLDKDTKVSEEASDNEIVELSKYLSKSENKDLSKFFTEVIYNKDNNKLEISVDKR